MWRSFERRWGTMPIDRVREAIHTARLADLALVLGKACHGRALTDDERCRAISASGDLDRSAIPAEQRVLLKGALLAVGRDVPVPQERLVEAHEFLGKLVQKQLGSFSTSSGERRP